MDVGRYLSACKQRRANKADQRAREFISHREPTATAAAAAYARFARSLAFSLSRAKKCISIFSELSIIQFSLHE